MPVQPFIYLINQASFEGYEDISVNIEAARLNVFIRKAQELDLKPFMGMPFYYDMLNDVDESDGVISAGAPYDALLNGTNYTDSKDNYLYFNGLNEALIYFAFSRFVEADYVRYTATGPVQKLHDQAEPLKPSDIAKLVQQHRSVANAKLNDAITFLDINKGDYPLWRYNARNAQARQSGPRIRGVDRTEINRGRYYDGNGFLNGLIG